MNQKSKDYPRPKVLKGVGRLVLFPEGCPVVKEGGHTALVEMVRKPMGWMPASKQCFCDICHIICPFRGKDYYPKELDGKEQAYAIFDPPSSNCLICVNGNGARWARFSMVCAAEEKVPFQICGNITDCQEAMSCKKFKPPL